MNPIGRECAASETCPKLEMFGPLRGNGTDYYPTAVAGFFLHCNLTHVDHMFNVLLEYGLV